MLLLRPLLFSLLLFFTTTCFAQETKEQLYAQLAHRQADTVRINTLYRLGMFYLSHYDQKGHLDSAETYLNKALIMAASAHRASEMNKCNFQLANVYLARNNLAVAEKYCTLVAQAHEVKHETSRQAQVWLKFGENVLNKLTDTGKKNPAYAAEMAELYYNRGKKILLTTTDTLDIIRKYVTIAGYYRDRNYERLYRTKVLEIVHRFEGTRFVEINAFYAEISQDHRDAGNNDTALYYLLKGMKRIERLRDTLNRQMIYGELALIYDELGQTENSVEWYKKTLALREKMPNADPAGLYRTAGFMALNLNKLGRSAEGLSYIKGLEKRRPPTDDNARGMVAQVKAYCYDGLKQYDQAEKYYLQMMAYYKNSAISYLRIFGTYDIADLYVRRKKYSEAAYYLKDMDLENFSISHKRNIQLMFFKIDSAAGRYSSAIVHYQQYKLLNDSIFNAVKSKQIEELQIKYATDQKERDLASLKKDRQLQYEKATQATSARNITFLGTGLLLIIVGLLHNSFRISRKKNMEIDRKNAALSRLVTEKDDLLEEKEWLMKEIHHRVKNNLQIVMGLLQRQSAFINNKEALDAIQNSENRMYAVALIHQKLYQSDSFTMVDMADYIDEMTGYLQEAFALGNRILFEKRIDPIDLEINVAVPLGLILNETITNAIKYAFAPGENGSIKIILNQTADHTYLLQIADNGIGLPEGFDMKKTNSMGLNLVRGLSKQIGGEIGIVNDNGVTINITFQTEQHIG